MSKIPKHIDDGAEEHRLCADCSHWKVSHSAFSGCVAGYSDDYGEWHDCFCDRYVAAKPVTKQQENNHAE